MGNGKPFSVLVMGVMFSIANGGVMFNIGNGVQFSMGKGSHVQYS